MGQIYGFHSQCPPRLLRKDRRTRTARGPRANGVPPARVSSPRTSPAFLPQGRLPAVRDASVSRKRHLSPLLLVASLFCADSGRFNFERNCYVSLKSKALSVTVQRRRVSGSPPEGEEHPRLPAEPRGLSHPLPVFQLTCLCPLLLRAPAPSARPG